MVVEAVDKLGVVVVAVDKLGGVVMLAGRDGCRNDIEFMEGLVVVALMKTDKGWLVVVAVLQIRI